LAAHTLPAGQLRRIGAGKILQPHERQRIIDATPDHWRFLGARREVAVNRQAVYLNFLFWLQFDFTSFGVDEQQRDMTIVRIMEAWNSNHIEIPLPPRE